MTVINQNRKAWNKKVEDGVVYTKAVSKELIDRCKTGEWEIGVTAGKPVPRNWFPESLEGMKVLCLASGGGQQGPVLAAAGADVTVVDLSEKQLEQDEQVAMRNGLQLKTIQGDMTDLQFFEDEQFDFIVHPVSNLFVEDIKPVWNEAARVLKDRGVLISGFTNPLLYIFDDEEEQKGNLEVRHSIPTSTIANFTEKELEEYYKGDVTVEFAHTLEDQIQGQIDAGFVIAGFYEDDFGGNRILDEYIKCFMGTRAVKLSL
ncbi:class I SAM-dependent methyltransferase [Pseudalkalibacillus berkeleyi]|uniref:Class I SAM-dependent methyltransferase n=1 Tax=Pseudalkalibacillus berkeleyi TaxID=1069813 RepID=A0ABS9GY75_9BACL|nr:class I SAM-dependent methyltransferase [Pseudalkalibacillus berkeleyi]MCF6136492.1 class I SAM-dependent methyltransferase [Pseudalkalibacillus berkeleyi]